MQGLRPGILALCAVCASASAQVELRSHERLDAPVLGASIAALELAPEGTGGPPRLVSWDRVRSVQAAGVNADRFAVFMDKLWRARTRVERSDFTAAAPLLDDLYQVYGAEDGPSAAVVAECMIRCRLARGAQGAATSSWLRWSSLMDRRAAAGEKAPAGAKPVWIGGSTDLPPIVDPGTRLAPAIPPIWTPGAGTQAAAASTEWQTIQARGGMAGELAVMYEKAARFEAGLDDEISLPGQASTDPAVGIVRDIVLGRAGDAKAREAARASIEQRLSRAAHPEIGKVKVAPMPAWLEAWLRMGLGQSFIRESDEHLRMRGVIELLHVPARFGSEQPNLAGIALADAAVVMAGAGDADAASALKSELLARYPGHPVLEWEALVKIPARESAAGSSRSDAMRGGVERRAMGNSAEAARGEARAEQVGSAQQNSGIITEKGPS
jgi:hypothetical protein